MQYTEECCLLAGVYTLKCKDSYGDGWHGGFISFKGTEYCENFVGGPEEAIEITIVPGKYRFSQGWMSGSIKSFGSGINK